MEMSMQMQQEPDGKPQIMQPPYTVDLSDSMADDESDAWTINNDQGSVAEMTCPLQDAEVTARFLTLAGNNHNGLIAALEEIRSTLRPVLRDHEVRGNVDRMEGHVLVALNKIDAALSAAQEQV